MEPIINPNIFYWAGVFDTIHNIGLAALIVGIALIIILSASVAIDIEWGYKEELKLCKKIFTILLIWLLIFILLFIFVPTKETIYAMCVSEVITPDNIDAITEKGEKGIQFICEQIEQVINNTAQSTN